MTTIWEEVMTEASDHGCGLFYTPADDADAKDNINNDGARIEQEYESMIDPYSLTNITPLLDDSDPFKTFQILKDMEVSPTCSACVEEEFDEKNIYLRFLFPF